MSEHEKGNTFNRRQFLGLSATTALAAGAIGLAGCSSSGNSASSSSSGSTSSTGTIAPGYDNKDGIGIPVESDSTEEADVVIVGSGMGGFVASMLSKELSPDSTVIMLEKNSTLGGNTNFAEGGGGFINLTPQEARIESMTESVARNCVVDNSLFYQLKLEQGDCSDWLYAKHGVEMEYYNTANPLYKGGHGDSAIATMTPQAEELGVDIRKESRAFALVLDDEYTVTGVQYDNGNQVIQINAKAVVLASGGMNNNPELLKLYANQDVEKTMPLGIGQDGDGHLMVEQTAHGRSRLQTIDGFMAGMGTNSEPGDFFADLNTAVGFQFSDIFVNQYGKRFYDESTSFYDGKGFFLTAVSQIVLAQAQTFSLFDESYIERWGNGEWQNGKNGYESGTSVPRSDYPLEVRDDIEAFSSASWFYQADSIEELGKAIAVDVDSFVVEDFVATVKAYNAAATGAQEFIWPLETGPFYAVKMGVNAYNTNGGIRIDRNARVIDWEGNPIQGLYASGIATAGWDSQVYGGGTNQPIALWCSCAAARHLAENILDETVPENWMGDVRISDIFEFVDATGNHLG